MAYDPVSRKVVLFGGGGDSGDLNDTWTFDGATWSQIVTTVAPSVRNGASMAFDRRTRQLVLFGGFGASMAFDRRTRQLVLFGGFSTDTYLQDTWLWDSTSSTWTQAQMADSPPPATGAMLFTDPVTGRVVMFGGYNSFNHIPVYNTTWGWTGMSWQKMNPSTVAYPRAWGIAALDTAANNVVLTGGQGDTIRTDNTWTWDGNNWSLLSPATQIPAFIGAGASYAPGVLSVIVFGGVGETWSWNGANWAQMHPAQSPSAREGAGMAYDPASHQTLIFGGLIANGPLVNETWLLVAQ
jgi:hypothetical protein